VQIFCLSAWRRIFQLRSEYSTRQRTRLWEGQGSWWLPIIECRTRKIKYD
jgi:hypothetical protein